MSPAFDVQRIAQASAKHPKEASIKYAYGTAGFRMKADLLDCVVFRVGLLAALRSAKMDGQYIGVMITASHNPEEDNGVKLVDPRGEMLQQSWEAYATSLANAADDAALVKYFEDLIQVAKVDVSKKPKVVYGFDTRPSCPALVAALEDALGACGVEAINFGLKTTPQLHYAVRCLNTQNDPMARYDYGKLILACDELCMLTIVVKANIKKLSPIHVDCANGVGAPKLRELAKYIDDVLDVKIVNDAVGVKGKLNFECGADYVKTTQSLPLGSTLQPGNRACSYDGDADRIVYYYVDDESNFRLLDGDKIASLAAMFIIDVVKAAELADQIKVGVVQTAYANGSSTHYLEKTLKVPVSCVSTGVKHLHHEAERYDVGVYFEANGHGTVLFSSAAQQAIRNAEERTPAQAEALAQLKALTELINQTVGDAMSDMLLVEAILAHKQWDLAKWDAAYTDLPNKLAKVIVPNRNKFKTTNAERQLTEPKDLQAAIDAEVAKYSSGRSFVRASGTEDAVRVYAEAASRAECDELIVKVVELVQLYA
ncbi:hypothetical protein BZG36_03563 [Bifiguratus adelaidae]|uniref:Phosphoacetylglucosamine mutase n=1 Tax=Bifiguratus adelaidae TaxID=1938954 RepID=A0A261Y0A8_9FUNG|nr:hypothetical protein BZG36_03563 [Bifiguratus adelaidae]